MCTHCPYFSLGNCNIHNCPYKNHIKCSKNYLCQYMDCPYGHSVSSKKRLIIQDIIKKKCCLNTNIQRCKSSITCYEPNCMLGHYVDYEHRMIINSIIKIRYDSEAEAIYYKQVINKESNSAKEPKYPTQCDINPSNLDNYMIVPKSTKLQDIVKNNLNTEIIKNKLITELQKQQQELIKSTEKLNKILFKIEQTQFEKSEIITQLNKLQKQYNYLVSTIHQP